MVKLYMSESKTNELNFKYWSYLYGMIDNFHKYGGLRIIILYELKDGPLKGIEISSKIEKHSKKLHEKKRKIYYKNHEKDKDDPFAKKVKTRPSPGSLYPRLKKMREEGLIIKRSDGKYENTELGFEKLNEVLEGVREKSEYFDRNPIENAFADLDNSVSVLEGVDEDILVKYEEELINLSRRLKKIAANILSKD